MFLKLVEANGWTRTLECTDYSVRHELEKPTQLTATRKSGELFVIELDRESGMSVYAMNDMGQTIDVVFRGDPNPIETA